MSLLNVQRARVAAITRAEVGIVHLQAVADGEKMPRTAIAYPDLTGPVAVGDTVHVNTTATGMGLGTGGVDFVLWNEVNGAMPETVFGDPDGTEHIIKLRYTPLQHAVRTVETNPAFAAVWENARTLEQMPVVVCELHSQIALVAAGIKATIPRAKVAYLMTDGAALPLAFSALVPTLKAAGLIDTTLTAGQAFGGDYECVTVASALIAARHIAHADIVIVGQGPGNAGTGTRYGFSGIEQGMYLDLAGCLGGAAIGVLRLSLADPRDRHHGLSHHSVTALGHIAQSPARVAFPTAFPLLRPSVEASPIAARHTVEDADGAPGIALLVEKGVRVTSMGRTPEQDPVFFHAASAAGALAAGRVRRFGES